MNRRKPKYFVVSVMTDDAKDQGVYLIKECHERKAHEIAENRFMKTGHVLSCDDAVQTLYKSRSKRDAIMFYSGYTEGVYMQRGY